MPGRFFLNSPITRIASDLGVDVGQVEPEHPRRNIKPGEQVITLTADGLTRMRWGMIPVGRVNARGRPVMETIVNARSETVFDKSAFDGVGRAVVPVDGWYEWTGKTRRKTAWRIRSADGAPLYFAAISDVWTAPGGQNLSQVATVTCEPSRDVRDIHDRMGVILEAQDIQSWLTEDEETVKPLMRPWPDGRLVVERADDVDWNAP